MKKQKSYAFDKNVYLLGRDEDGRNYWLEEASWDCDWYWGFGYIESYTNNANPSRARDIYSHEHFSSLGYDGFKAKFKETPLNDSEIWQLCELMRSFYIAREYSDMLHRGGSNYSHNPCKDTIKNEDEYKRINEVVIPEICKAVYKLLEN